MRINIVRYREHVLSMGFEDGRVEYLELTGEDESLIGSVYVGRVCEVRKNLDACFVRIQPGVKGFLKFSECPGEKKPAAGDDVVVRVRSASLGAKGVSLSMKVRGELREKGRSRTLYSCLEKGRAGYVKHLEGEIGDGAEEIVTDDAGIYEELMKAAEEGSIDAGRIRLYNDRDVPLIKLYSMEERLRELVNKKVWLKSGAYLVIEHTEALNVIDVNSGKMEKSSDRLTAVHRVNLEAAAEAARQIRLRNLSGIIVIDFINYREGEEAYVNELREELEKALSTDRLEPGLIDITPLYLAEITRRRSRAPLYMIIH